MMGLVLLGVFISVLIVSAICLVMFAEVAYAGPRAMRVRSLPLLVGAPLKAWAALRSRIATGKWLADNPERVYSDKLARRIEADAGQVLDQAIFRDSPESQGVQRCQDATGVPQVTAPEAFAMAAELRKLPSGRLRDLRQHVLGVAQTGWGGCPLLTTEGTCLCAVARPLECRARCLAGFDSSHDAMDWAQSLEEGMIEGLQHELNGAGLDGRRYDLNIALARVLTDPDSEGRWRRGERLLATETNVASSA